MFLEPRVCPIHRLLRIFFDTKSERIWHRKREQRVAAKIIAVINAVKAKGAVMLRYVYCSVSRPLLEPNIYTQKNTQSTDFTACSNCTKYKKECTFKWLSMRTESRRHQRRLAMKSPATANNGSQSPSNIISDSNTLSDAQCDSLPSWHAHQPGRDRLSPATVNRQLGEPLEQKIEESSEAINYDLDSLIPGFSQVINEDSLSQTPLESALEFLQQVEESKTNIQRKDMSRVSSFQLDYLQRSGNMDSIYSALPQSQKKFCLLSDRTANEYARVRMTQNLIRIYHDSMENALSCWLTERNCPYSNEVDALGRLEWGPDWSNRICARVCRLDHANAAIQGHKLIAAEDKTAARALHLSIMAFALQWAQNFNTAPLAQHERSMRREVWHQARHALQNSGGIHSFRVVFANILFSLTQRPLDSEKELGLDEILNTDDAATFLETALRQLFSYRYKLTLLQKQAPSQPLAGILKKLDTDPCENKIGGNMEADAILANPENRDTLDLLFWLGVMFDTQTAAMHRRPPVVSDEDSEVSLAQNQRNSTHRANSSLDLDGWNLPSASNERTENKDLWGDYIIDKSPRERPFSAEPTRWPCSYEEAAAILSDGAPVKVLLYRRVTQLQTLIYRGTYPDRLEEVIHKALIVYRHWNKKYNVFIRDCVANHSILPPRIQSWYVILAAHWHLGAMLLADVIEEIDQRQLSSVTQREAREAMSFVVNLRRDNAYAVASLAQCSLYEQGKSVQPRQFHDSLAEAAFLTEPFTVLLIQALARAGCILLDMISGVSPFQSDHNSKILQESCAACIRALKCLGRKSDMALLVGRTLASSFKSKCGVECYADDDGAILGIPLVDPGISPNEPTRIPSLAIGTPLYLARSTI